MVEVRCPLCGSPCILKIVATEDARWCEVDVCKMCQTMYPRGKVVKKAPVKKAKAKPKPKKAKAKGKKRKK